MPNGRVLNATPFLILGYDVLDVDFPDRTYRDLWFEKRQYKGIQVPSQCLDSLL